MSLAEVLKGRVCWNCLKKTMTRCPELGEGWFKCSECGATHVDIPELLSPLLGATWVNPLGMKTYHPHPRAKGKKVKK